MIYTVHCHVLVTQKIYCVTSKNPVTLCKNDRLTELIVWNNYNRIIHLGVRQTLAGIRSCYWILRGKSLVKKVLHRYMI